MGRQIQTTKEISTGLKDYLDNKILEGKIHEDFDKEFEDILRDM